MALRESKPSMSSVNIYLLSLISIVLGVARGFHEMFASAAHQFVIVKKDLIQKLFPLNDC